MRLHTDEDITAMTRDELQVVLKLARQAVDSITDDKPPGSETISSTCTGNVKEPCKGTRLLHGTGLGTDKFLN